MIVTTAGRTNDEMIELAKTIAIELDIPFTNRMKQSIEEIMAREQQDVLVAAKNRYVMYRLHHPDEPIFFHPNSAMFRVKRINKGEEDPFIYAAKLESGMNILDCTLGLGSDSIVASSVLGTSGHVVGIEGNRYLAFLLEKGLRSWDSGNEEVNGAMRRIKVQHSDHLTFLKSLPSESFDVVYFDPMFEEIIEESNGIKGLRGIALYTDIEEETIEEAKRVAKKRIVLKDFWRSTRFNQYGFSVYRRKTAKFHFGVIEKY